MTEIQIRGVRQAYLWVRERIATLRSQVSRAEPWLLQLVRDFIESGLRAGNVPFASWSTTHRNGADKVVPGLDGQTALGVDDVRHGRRWIGSAFGQIGWRS